MSRMDSPHSFSFSNAPSTPQSKRASLSQQPQPQLPLHSTLTQRPQSPSTPSTLGGITAESGSPTPYSVPRTQHAQMQAPKSPTSHHPGRATASSTHAGGIQPSPSFFRPSRPSQVQNASRPSSVASTNVDLGDLPQDKDVYPLSNLHKRLSTSSVGAESDQEEPAPLKKRRGSLLPLENPQRHSMSLTQGRDSSDGPPGGGPLSPRRLVRNSIEMVINLRHGLSFDSSRRSPGTQESGRIHDEEQGKFKPAHPSSPGHLTNSLHITTTRSPSPSPSGRSFIPIPPHETLSEIVKIDPKTRRSMRNYQLHQSRNRFFLGGRLLTGGDSPWAFIACFTVALVISGVWFGTTCVWWWHNQSPAVAIVGAYGSLLVVSTMLTAAFSDPGILPRNLDPNPPYPATSPSDGGVRAPMPRDLKVRADVVRVKYCPTCKTYRPPRSSHCRMCDNCVDGCDHHCQWVNNCVGRRNYTSFIALLLSATLMLVLVIVTSALHLYLLTRREDADFRNALSRGAGSAVGFCLSIVIIWPVAALLSYHMRLLLLNITTIEQIRNQAHKTLVPGPAPPNPFSHGTWRRNLVAVLCRPQGYSWLNARGIATEDKREVNPGAGS